MAVADAQSMQTIHPHPDALAHALGRTHRRLELQTEQLAASLARLKRRSRALERDGLDLPPPLRRRLDEFESELTELREELAMLAT